MNNIAHYQVTAELVDDDQGQMIALTQQDGMEAPSVVCLHPWQLKAILAQFEVLAADKDAEMAIAKLKRRMTVLRDRIDHLGNYLKHHSDHDHANLDYEVTYITATADIANEFCADLVEAPAEPCAPPVAASHHLRAPSNIATVAAASAEQPALI